MSFKHYLNNLELPLSIGVGALDQTAGMPITPIQTIPQGVPIVSPKIMTVNTQQDLWTITELNGSKFIILNENYLIEGMRKLGLLIKDGKINYNPTERKIIFEIKNILSETPGLEQLQQLKGILSGCPSIITSLEIDPQRVIININAEYNLGGIS